LKKFLQDEDFEESHIDGAVALIRRYCIPNLGLLLTGFGSLIVNSVTNLSFPRLIGSAVAFSSKQSTSPGEKKGFYLWALSIVCVGSMASFLRVYSLEQASLNMERAMKVGLM